MEGLIASSKALNLCHFQNKEVKNLQIYMVQPRSLEST